MKRVVVTGMGIWSSLGQDAETVTKNLREGKSGIVFCPEWLEYGLQSGLVGNVPSPNLKQLLPRKFRVTMGEDAKLSYMSVLQALRQAKMTDEYLCLNEVGLIWGSEGNPNFVDIDSIMQSEHDTRMLDGSHVFKFETSSVSMNLSTIFHLRGINMSVSSGCASASNAIGLAYSFIRNGMQNAILVGGASEPSKLAATTFNATGGMSVRNDEPTKASRPFDIDRDGVVYGVGSAALVLEEYEHAMNRGAEILAEIIGWGTTSNGVEDISKPCWEGNYRAIVEAMREANIGIADVDYVNSGATSSIIDDVEEAIALSKLFANTRTWISSTESMTGHEVCMAGASEAIYSILMMQHGFVAPNINLEHKIEEAKDLRIARNTTEMPIRILISTSVGLGGTNSALVFKKI